ncbi:MAG: hypothetical protein KJ689_06255 [Bacteroidetes bacterium]|nr:hypothetical protein [Bacteroidota bacterium]
MTSGLLEESDAFRIRDPKENPPEGAVSVYPEGTLIVAPPAPTPFVLRSMNASTNVG